MGLIRMWINQPSTLQPFHKVHGLNVLAEYQEGTSRIYFLEGSIISQNISSNCLSKGWKLK